MMLYVRPVALNRTLHAGLKLDSRPGDFGFARATNSLLLAASEIADASRDYPVVFVANGDGRFTLAALLGLRDRENLFVDADGQWSAGAYVPAFARRYPFVLAEAAPGTDDLTVCFDEAYPGFGTADGAPLFEADGAATPLLRNATDFLTRYHAEMQQTALFARTLADAGLLVEKSIQVQRDGGTHTLDGIYVVDRTRLAALDDTQSLALLRSGALYAVHAHLMSLGQVDHLARRLEAHAAPPLS
jgi:hypothetical protein